MAKDARQLRDDASAAATAGKHKRALECYLELERLEPTDAQWPKRVAETYRRLGKMREAVSAFERAADRYAQNGFLVQAIAVCKLILQIDPSHVDTQQRLAAINAAQGAGPTRIGTLSDNHPSLHENPAVALLRARSLTPDDPRGDAGRLRPASSPPVVSFVEPGRGAGHPGSPGSPGSSGSFGAADPGSSGAFGSSASPSSSGSFGAAGSGSPFSGYSGPGQAGPGQAGPGQAGPGQAGPAPSPRPGPGTFPPPDPSRYPPPEPLYPPLPTTASPTGYQPPRGPLSGPPPNYPPAAPSGYSRPGSSSGAPSAPMGSHQSASQPIVMPRGQGLDSVTLGSVVAGSHQQRDDGSQPGIVIIPIDRDEDSLPIDVYLDEDGSRPTYSHGQGSGFSDPSIELDLAELEAQQYDEAAYDPDDIPLASPRHAGAAARQALAATPLFAGLSEGQLEALISRIELMTLAPGQILLREGELGDALYVIADGEVVVEAVGPPRVAPSVLSAGAFFGEVTLITDHPRMATVTAQTMVEALRIDRDALAFVVARHPEVVTALLRFVRDRLVERWMRTSPLCRPFEERQRREFASRFRFLEIEAGSVVMAPGDQADGLYIVLAGQFIVERDGVAAAVLGPGELIGETVLMTGDPLHSTVMAATKCLALWLPVEHFREVIMIHPHVLEYVGAQAERRRLQIY